MKKKYSEKKEPSKPTASYLNMKQAMQKRNENILKAKYIAMNPLSRRELLRRQGKTLEDIYKSVD